VLAVASAARVALVLAGATLAASALACAGGCSGPSRPDASFDRDATFVLDNDGDGLCDDTELARGTDPFDPDTDGDGFPDLVEIQIYADALMIDSPDRDDLVALRVERLSTSATPLTFTVRATGGTYVGGFAARTRPLGDETSANDYFLRASAVTATPSTNVANIDGEVFAGVIGRTLLTYQIDFEYRDDALIECMRAYPFSYQLKLQDQSLVGVQSRILLVAPNGMQPGSGTWCPPTSACF
jgi:hypothetical protein